MAREDSFFDELARGLADGSVTRGKALKLMGAALSGARLDLLASVRPLPILLAVSATGRPARGITSAVAGAALAEAARRRPPPRRRLPLPLRRLCAYPIATPPSAPASLSAAADYAP